MLNITTFPTEIIPMIADQLDEQRDLFQFAMAHSQLLAATIPLLWKNITIQGQGRCLRFLNCLVKVKAPVRQCIQHVHLQGFHWNDRALMILMRRAPRVVSLVLDNATRITDTSIQHIPQYWPSLQSLHLESSPITDMSYRALGQLTKLTHLVLNNCSGLQPNTLSIHFVDSPLKQLSLGAPENTRAMDPWIDLRTGLCHVTHLRLHGAPFGMLHLPRLTSVELEACFGMSDNEAIPLVRGLPATVTHLTIKDAEFTNVTLDAVATYLPNLTTLDVSFNSHLTPKGIRRLIRHHTNLCMLKLAYCSIKMYQFPEAGPTCIGTVITYENTFVALDHLDQKAMDLIRRGPDLADQDQQKRRQ